MLGALLVLPAAEHAVLRDGLTNCRIRFDRDGVGRVAFLGGSITEAQGWRNLVQDDLQRRFPRTRFEWVAAGIPSLGSNAHAFRYRRDVLAQGPVDLLFVEAAVNDSTNGLSDAEQVRGMEGIVRQARRDNPAIDVVMLHFADPDKLADVRAGRRPAVIANHERVAERYGVPSIDLAGEVAERIAAGEFTWEGDFRDLHPAPFGHALYAKSVAQLFDAAWASPLADGAALTAHALPMPVDACSYDDGRLVAPDQATVVSEWRLDPSWRPTDGAGTRYRFVDVPVLVAEQAGAELTLRFTGRGVGVFVAAGPDAGTVEYRVDGGPSATRDLFSPWSGGLHLPWAQMLVADLPPGDHVLTLTVSTASNPASGGHAVRIVHFLVN